MTIGYDAPGRVSASVLLVPKTHGITFAISETEKAAGFLACCPECRVLFRDSTDWAFSDCRAGGKR